MNVPVLESARLLLHPLELTDANQIQVLFPQWEIVRYLDKVVPWPYPPDGAYKFIHDIALPAIERGDAWHWTIRLKTSPHQLIGLISLLRREGHNRGFWMGLPWQNQGFISEASGIATEYWFNTLGFPVMRVSKAIANIASRRISEKNRMRMVATEEREYVSGRLLTEIWEITAEEWNARKPLQEHCR